MEGARRAQGGELAWGNRQQQATTKQSIEANRISGGANADMHHAGPRSWAWRPEHAHPRPQAMLPGEAGELLDPRQQIGLLLLHQHPPAQGLLKTATAAVAVTACQHQGAGTHCGGAGGEIGDGWGKSLGPTGLGRFGWGVRLDQ